MARMRGIVEDLRSHGPQTILNFNVENWKKKTLFCEIATLVVSHICIRGLGVKGVFVFGGRWWRACAGLIGLMLSWII